MQNRIDWVDVAKGICICFVVMMHSTLGVEKAAGETGWMGYFVEFARPFRMPDFFLIAGLFLASRINAPWRLYLDRWPEAGVVALARGPVMSVDAVRAFDELGEESEVSLAGHVLDSASRPARLWLRERPNARQAINGVEVDFTAGFGEAGEDVPDTLKRAMLIHAAHMYEFRGAVPVEMPPAGVPDGYDRLVAPYLMRRL